MTMWWRPGTCGARSMLWWRGLRHVLAASLVLCQRHPGAIDTYLPRDLAARRQRLVHGTVFGGIATEWMALAVTGTPLSIVGAIFKSAAFRKCRHWHDFPLWHDRLMLAEMGLHGDVDQHAVDRRLLSGR